VTDIFEEVDESLRQDTALKWWKRALPFLIAGVVAVIGAVAAFEFFRAQRAAEIDAQARVYDTAATAIEAENLAAAKTALAQVGQGDGGFAAIANHMLAGVEKEMTNDPAAIAQQLRAAAEAEGLLGDMGTLKLAYVQADTVGLAELEATVRPLIDKGGHIGSLARELVAAKALAAGEVERARSEYQALSFELEAPESMKVRVSRTLETLPPRPVAEAAPPAASTPAPGSAAPAAQPSAQPSAAPAQQ
jgi:hypothetical protein